jgi:hypothetical protein
MNARRKVIALLGSTLLCVAMVEVGSALYFRWVHGTLPYGNAAMPDPQPGAATDTQPTGFKQRLHPYFGFAHPYSEVGRTDGGEYMINDMGFPQNSPYRVPFVPEDGDFVAVVFGGSVASNVVAPPQGGRSIERALAALPVLKGRNVIVYSMAQGSGKQPQQLIALAFLLALGQHVDLVVNVDGFNEAALGYTNYGVGMHPILPAAQIVGALALSLQQAGAGTAEFYEVAYKVSKARAGVVAYSERLPRSSSGLEYLANVIGLAWNERDLRTYLPSYDAAIKASGDWGRAKSQLSLDMPYRQASDREKMQETFDVWLRSSRQMRLLAEANGIGYVHVVQPYILRSKPHLTKEEEAIARTVPESHVYYQPAKVIYEMFAERKDVLTAHGILSAVDLFAERTDTMYVDPFHYSATGETLLADFVAAEASRWIEACHPELASRPSAGLASRCRIGEQLRLAATR